jgi:hypothetical protein
MQWGAIIFVVLVSTLTAASAACGDRGGPGYRGPDRQCVSWLNIGRICGCPPTTRCIGERVRLGAGKAAKLGCEMQKLRGH